MKHPKEKSRCAWVSQDPLYIDYHDHEWGRPIHDDQKLFEFLILESFQAGLSWLTILRKRENFRKAFANFDPKKVARFTDKKVRSLMNDAGIIRNRLKILAAISNARLFLDIQKEFGSFDSYVWKFVKGKIINNSPQTIKDIPARSEVSDAMSLDMKKQGFKFRGSTICYAFMQAVGMVNDHTKECFLSIKKNR